MISKHTVNSYNEFCFDRRAVIKSHRANMFPRMDISVRPRELLNSRITAWDF